MTYDEAIEWLLSFADFERSGRFQDRPDVAPMLALLERLGNPHLGRTTVHIAGSKGKGSVAAMVAAIADEACPGSTSLYTSPHLHSYYERVALLDEPITEDEFASLVGKRFKPALEDDAIATRRERSFVTFDLLTALFFVFSKERSAQMQVIETGLGGRVDSTNVFVKKKVAVITPISLEHTAILGDTIEQIAREKAAIITPGCMVVMAPQPFPAAELVIREFARRSEVTNRGCRCRIPLEETLARPRGPRIVRMRARQASSRPGSRCWGLIRSKTPPRRSRRDSL